VARTLSEQILPGTRPELDASDGVRLSFALREEGIRKVAEPHLLIQGSGIGAFADPARVLGHSDEYQVPQLLVLLSYVDPAREVARCGYAILEPSLATSAKDHGWFRGLKRLALGEGDEDALLCGVVKGFQDRHGGLERGTGDGQYEILVERHVVNHRLQAIDPKRYRVYKETYLLDLSGTHPEVVGEVLSEEVDFLPKSVAAVHVERTRTDEVRIVSDVPLPEELEDLPQELAEVHEGLPELRFLSVERQGATTRFTAVAPSHFAVSSAIRAMVKQNMWQVLPMAVHEAEDGVHFQVSYSPKTEQPKLEK
jgi:hypothetical protein